MISVRFP